MSTESENALVDWYETRIGSSSTTDEAYGYWVFVAGVIAGVIGIGLVLVSGVESFERGAGSMIAAIALLLLLIGPVIRLPLRRTAALLSYFGAVVSLLAVAWFFVAYPDNFGTAFDGQEVEIIALYGLGIVLIAAGGVFTPILTSPREEQEAAERRAAEAEAERDHATREAEKQATEAETQAAEAERYATEAAEERSQREAFAAELDRINQSQSQFELYTDAGGKHRWRLRHRNRNIIADSSQGYASRQKAQQGIAAVKRDAFGGAILDLDDLDVEVEAAEDAIEGEDAPAFLPEADSQATFEAYEDDAGEHRWRLVHDNGNIIADSGEGYASGSGRDESIERVRGYVQTAQYLRIEPAAFELYRDKAGKYRWRLLHRNGNIIADSGQGYASRQKARQGLESVKRNITEGGNATVETYEDNAGEHRWRLVHDNGNNIANSSEGYSSKQGVEEAIERVREYAPEADVLDIGAAAFELFRDASDEWRWHLRHRNGRILADGGEGYSSRNGAIEGINSVKQNAPNADVEQSG